MYKTHKNIVYLAITSFFLLTFFSANASLKLANHLFENQKYDAAFVEFEKEAHLGLEAAQLKLAVMYMEGIGIQKNIVQSYVYLLLAADNGNTQAKEYATQFYNSFDGDNKTKADKLWQEMSQKYSVDGLTDSALPELKQKLTNERRAKQKYKTNSISSFTYSKAPKAAIRSLSVTYDVGKDGKARDIEIERNFFMPPTGIDASFAEVNNTIYSPATLLSDKYQPVTSYGYNKRWSSGRATASLKNRAPKFYTKLKKWEKQAKNGDLEAQFHYAMVAIYFPFLSLDPTKKIVRSYIKNAAESGLSDAQLEYSKMLQRGGKHFTKDIKASTNYLVAAAKAGNARAQYKLGRQLLNSNVVSSDESKAIFWLNKSANQQDSYAKYWLARVLLTSEDNSLRNPEKAQILLTETKKVQEQNPNWYYYAALAEYQLNNNTQSKVLITSAIDKAEKLEWKTPEFIALANKVI